MFLYKILVGDLCFCVFAILPVSVRFHFLLLHMFYLSTYMFTFLTQDLSALSCTGAHDFSRRCYRPSFCLYWALINSAAALTLLCIFRDLPFTHNFKNLPLNFLHAHYPWLFFFLFMVSLILHYSLTFCGSVYRSLLWLERGARVCCFICTTPLTLWLTVRYETLLSPKLMIITNLASCILYNYKNFLKMLDQSDNENPPR